MLIAEKHQIQPWASKSCFHTTLTPPTHAFPQTHSTQAPLQAAHVEDMKDSPYDELAGKPTGRPANGGGVIITDASPASSSSSSTNTTNKKAASTYSRAYEKGCASSLPGGRSLRAQRQQHQHRSLWMACGQCLCGTRAEEWGSKLRQFLVGELPGSLSLPTKIRIVLEVSKSSIWG